MLISRSLCSRTKLNNLVLGSSRLVSLPILPWKSVWSVMFLLEVFTNNFWPMSILCESLLFNFGLISADDYMRSAWFRRVRVEVPGTL